MQRFVRYSAIGAVATAAHYAVLLLAVEAAGLAPWWASGLGAVVGAQVAYIGNRHYTFAHRGPVRESWLRFQGTAVLGALIGMAVVALGTAWGAHYLAAQVLATALTLVVTYLINRSWSFG